MTLLADRITFILQCTSASMYPKVILNNENIKLDRIEGVTQFNKVLSSKIRKSLNLEPLLLQIERSQRWFGHVSRMPPQERLPKQALLAKANERRLVGRPRTRWTNCIEDLGWNRLGLHPSEMMDVMEDREMWRLNHELLPQTGKAGNGEKEDDKLWTSDLSLHKRYKFWGFH